MCVYDESRASPSRTTVIDHSLDAQMRFLDTSTGRLHTIDKPSARSYAILSHIWSDEDIKTYASVRDRDGNISHLSQKIRDFCAVAREHKFQLAWMDSCCIDKNNAAEVSEAVVSRFNWYANAGACFVYLPEIDIEANSPPESLELRRKNFHRSKWFSRMRTLQELLAPEHVIFLSKNWSVIGTNYSLASFIESETSIDADVLTRKKPLESVSIARRMFWASERSATRVEDEAYWLAGIFGVTLQPMYGEGRAAFLRLQEEIIKHIPGDQTIFAWGHTLDPQPEASHRPGLMQLFRLNARTVSVATSSFVSSRIHPYPSRYLLASSPKDFTKWSSHLMPVSTDTFATRTGISLSDALISTTSFSQNTLGRLPVGRLRECAGGCAPSHVALLACEDPAMNGGLVALLLHPQRSPGATAFYVGGLLKIPVSRDALNPADYVRMVYVARPQKEPLKALAVYIPKFPSDASRAFTRDAPFIKALFGRMHQPLDIELTYESSHGTLPVFNSESSDLPGLQICSSESHHILSHSTIFSSTQAPQVFTISLTSGPVATLAIGWCALDHDDRHQPQLPLVALVADSEDKVLGPLPSVDNALNYGVQHDRVHSSFRAGVIQMEVLIPDHIKLLLILRRFDEAIAPQTATNSDSHAIASTVNTASLPVKLFLHVVVEASHGDCSIGNPPPDRIQQTTAPPLSRQNGMLDLVPWPLNGRLSHASRLIVRTQVRVLGEPIKNLMRRIRGEASDRFQRL